MNAITGNTPVGLIMELFDIEEDTANRIKDYALGRRDPSEHPAGEKRYRECYHAPSLDDMALHVIDSLLGTHGVEGWYDDDLEVGISYANTGDTYAYTIVQTTDRYRNVVWFIASYGDVVEHIEAHSREDS